MRSIVIAAAWLALASGAFAASTTLTGTVRDFNADGVNFEGGGGPLPGLVEPTLTGSSPTLTPLGLTQISNSGAGAFSNWYTKATDSMPLALTLDETAPGSGTFAFASSSFFPIDGLLLGNEGRPHNYHFTFAIHAQFGYTPGAGQTFSFTGDDDVWVFFDKKLGIDLGGIHPAMSQSVSLDTLFGFGTPGAQAAGNYAFDFFFAERHTTQSNLNIQTSLRLTDPPPPIPEPSTFALMALGGALLGAFARRRRG